MPESILYYVHDPMCSWCWGFRHTWQQLKQQLPEEIAVKYLLGGLAPDSTIPMPQELQASLQHIWQRIQQQIPGTVFNFNFWTDCKPRRSTYPACRAVIAARLQNTHCEEAMILAIQHAYYRQAKNPSDDDTLIQLADDLNLDIDIFTTTLNAPSTQAQLERERQEAQRLGASGFPRLIITCDGIPNPIPIDYNNPEAILSTINHLITNEP